MGKQASAQVVKRDRSLRHGLYRRGYGFLLIFQKDGIFGGIVVDMNLGGDIVLTASRKIRMGGAHGGVSKNQKQEANARGGGGTIAGIELSGRSSNWDGNGSF
jgi:hypothetical protein